MQIKYLGKEQFEIKSAEAIVTLSAEGVDIDGFKISTPGEYERGGVSVLAINYNEDNGVVYQCIIEDMTLLFPSLLRQNISDEVVKDIGNIDILFVPLGAEDTLNVSEAQKLVAKIDPRLVIPMLFSDISEFKTAEGFANEEQEVLKIKKTDLPQEERRFTVLKAQS